MLSLILPPYVSTGDAMVASATSPAARSLGQHCLHEYYIREGTTGGLIRPQFGTPHKGHSGGTWCLVRQTMTTVLQCKVQSTRREENAS